MNLKFVKISSLTSIAVLIISATSVSAAPNGVAFQIGGTGPAVGNLKMHFTDRMASRFAVFGSYLPNSQDLAYEAALPPCISPSQEMCIEGFSISTSGDTSWMESRPEVGMKTQEIAYSMNNADGSMTPKRYETFGAKSESLFAGNVPYVWNSDKYSHLGGNKYMVTVLINSSAIDKSHLTNIGSSYSFSAFIIPVGPNQGAFGRASAQDSNGTWLTSYDFPKGQKYRLTLRLKPVISKLETWFQARLHEPIVEIETTSGKLTVTGEPVVVSTAVANLKYEEMTSKMKSNFGSWGDQIIARQNQSNIGWDHTEQDGMSGVVDRFLLYEPFFTQTAEGDSTLWRLATTGYSGNGPRNCMKSGIVNGVMSTNATVYEPTPPIWSNSTSSLDFKIASTHTNSMGQENVGDYYLMLRPEFAKCIWGSDSAGAVATISVVNSDGTNQVATTIMGKVDGWIRFEAAGFHFSAPTIKVKLDPEVTPVGADRKSALPNPNNSQVAKLQPKKIVISKKVTRKKIIPSPKPTMKK